jgi:hypothetical protein
MQGHIQSSLSEVVAIGVSSAFLVWTIMADH